MKDKLYGNGKIILCDFYRLNVNDFLNQYPDLSRHKLKNGTLLATIDGKVYINSRWKPSKIIAEGFDVLVKQTRETLVKTYAELKKRFPTIKDIDDWNKMQGTSEEKLDAFAMVLIPIEFDRRKVEEEYFL